MINTILVLGLLTILIISISEFFHSKKNAKVIAQKKYYHSLLNVNPHPILIRSANSEISFASESIKELLGYKKKEKLKKSPEEHISPDFLSAYHNFLLDLYKSKGEKKTMELRLINKQGQFIWVKNDSINLLEEKNINSIISNWQDITPQKIDNFQKEELLKNEKEAREIAEKAILDRDEFLSIASHELKTPLTTVLLQLQGTLRKIMTQSLADFSGHDLLDSLQIAEKQSKSLSTLIKDLLNVSLASTGRLTLTKETTNLSGLVEGIVKKYSEEIKLSGCEITTDLEDKNVIGNWDPIRLEQAITNLLMNALKYAKDKKVYLKVSKSDQYAIFQITDEGEGIPEYLLTHIFEPFKRANSNPAIKGLGVGLFITNQIVLAHLGSINVESEANKGTTFKIFLPLYY